MAGVTMVTEHSQEKNISVTSCEPVGAELENLGEWIT